MSSIWGDDDTVVDTDDEILDEILEDDSFLGRSRLAPYLVWPHGDFNCASIYEQSRMGIIRTLWEARATLDAAPPEDKPEIRGFIDFLEKALEYRESEKGAKTWEKRQTVKSELSNIEKRIENTPPGNLKKLLQKKYERLDDLDFKLEGKEFRIGQRAYNSACGW